MFWSNRKNHVPKAQGPYRPGCVDIMDDYGKDSTFIRIYYPSNAKNSIDSYESWWPTWLPDKGYVAGIANVLNLWPFVVKVLVYLMSGTIYVPAVYGAKLLENNNNKKKLGTILLSHGLGGNRFLYTSTCIELASYGFCVFAIEHKDGSSCRTYYYENKENVKCDVKTFIEHEKIKLGSSHYDARNKQVKRRKDELFKALDLIYKLNSGEKINNILTDLPIGPNPMEFDISQLTDRLDLETLTLMGHSFGAATALYTLSCETSNRFKQGVFLDSWMFPVKNENLSEKIKKPLIFVNTQTFQISSNVNALQPFLSDKGNGDGNENFMYTILNTTHESQTDSTFVIGHWLNWFMKKTDPKKAVRITCALVLNFLKERTKKYPEEESFENIQKYLKDTEMFYYDGLTKPWA